MNLLFSELPYASALHVDYLRQRCSNCFAIARAQCSRCHIVVYCNRDCQGADWNYHKFECSGLSNGAFNQISPSSIDVAVRLLARILLRYELDKGEVNETTGFATDAKLRYLSNLMSHSDQYNDHQNPKAEFFNQIRTYFINSYGLSELWRRHPEEEIKELLGKCQTNVFDITEDTIDGFLWLGSGVYLNASRFDHSCDPDIHWSFDGRKIQANLLKPDSANKPIDTLTVNYGFGEEPYSVGGIRFTSERRKYLLRQYHFVCHCNLCDDKNLDIRKNWSLKWNCPTCQTPYCITGDDQNSVSCLTCNNVMVDCPMKPEEIIDQIDIARKHLRDAHNSEQHQRKNMAVSNALKILQTFAHPIHNVWCCRANLELFFMATERIDDIPYTLLSNNIFIGEKILKTHELYAPVYDLTYADVAYRLSNLYRKMNNSPRAKNMLEKVRKSWEAKCGSIHPCVKFIEYEFATFHQ